METESGLSSSSSGSSRRATVRRHAREALPNQSGADGESVKETVLKAMYRHHPEIALEDVLELNALVSAPESGSSEERIDTVLASALEHSKAVSTNSPETTPEAQRAAVISHGDR